MIQTRTKETNNFGHTAPQRIDEPMNFAQNNTLIVLRNTTYAEHAEHLSIAPGRIRDRRIRVALSDRDPDRLQKMITNEWFKAFSDRDRGR